MMKIRSAVLHTALFVLLLALVHWLHMRFVRVDVVFYAAIADGIIAASLAAMALWRRARDSVFTLFEKQLLVVLWVVCGYAFAISVPTVIDRSLSFYILEKLKQRGGGIPLADMERVFREEYLREHRLIDVRVTEQLESGTVRLGNGCVELTPRGHRLAALSTLYRRHWLPPRRLLMGEYSDALVDPLKSGSSTLPGCRIATPPP